MGISGLRTHVTTVPAEFLVKVAMQSCQKERQELSSVMVNGGLPPSIATPMLADVDKRTEQMSAMAILELRVP